MNNAFYGKTMENVRGRVNVQFCFDKEKFVKYTSSPLFANQINIIKEDGLCLVKTHKKTVELNKPIYIGATVLDFSKLLMMRFHYQTMLKEFPNALMMKTDTDSLLYYIETDDLYADIKESKPIQKMMEFSNYPKNNFLYNDDRKKVPGLFQDECVDAGGPMQIISEYVGLRAKCYTNKLYSPDADVFTEKKKCKGISKVHLKKRINFDDYKTCLMTGESVILGDENAAKEMHKEKMQSFISHDLRMYTIEQTKVALSSQDDKRIPIVDKEIYTYAIGHYKIKTNTKPKTN
jgi:hypothetical protein